MKGCSACTWTWGEGGGGGGGGGREGGRGVGEHTHSRAVPSQCLGAVLEPDLGQRADAIVREELFLVQHVSQHPQQPLLGGDGQEVAELPITKRVQVGDLDKVEKSHHLLSLLSLLSLLPAWIGPPCWSGTTGASCGSQAASG